MNTDIRISTSFLNHRKRKKLKQILGPGSTDYLIDLWINTALNRPKGVLYDMDKSDIALDAGWEGRAELFVDTLLEVGFLDFDGECFKLHDWDKHQSWAIGADDRSLAAAKNQVFRWCLKEIPKKEHTKFKEWYYQIHRFVKGSNTETILPEYESYTNGNTPILSSPIPSSPILSIEENKSTAGAESRGLPSKDELDNGSPILIKRTISDMVEKLYLEKIFPKVHAFKNKMVKDGMNDKAILHVLSRCYVKGSTDKFDDKGPWGYCLSIMKVENGNYNERDHNKAN
jgi:hypothetical protein